jgi:hypothetical protein
MVMTLERGRIDKITRGETKLPTDFWLIDWSGPADESEWQYADAENAFTTNGFAGYTPLPRSLRTAAGRALQRQTNSKQRQVHVADDLLAVPDAKRINRPHTPIGADLSFRRRAVVRVTGNEARTTADFEPVFRPEIARQQGLVWGYDVKRRWSVLILGALNGYRWRPGAFFVQNQEPYAAGMWRFAELVRAFGAGISTIPLHDEAGNHAMIAERALDSLLKDFAEAEQDLDALLARARQPKARARDGVRTETIARQLTKVSALKQKLDFVVDKVGYELEDLQAIGGKRLAEVQAKLRALRGADDEEDE